MSDERDRILKMVEAGAITANEAAELLAALNDEDGPQLHGSTSEKMNPPWEVPLIAGIVISGFGLLGLMRKRKGNMFSRLGAWATFLLGIGAAVAGYWSRSAPWLHINVKEPDGHTIHLSVPLLLPLARGIINLAHSFVDAGTAQQLEDAAAFIQGLERGERVEPVSIEVEDGKGAQVHLYVA